jgi:hypothetical protein
VPFDLEEPEPTDPPTVFDLDIVAVHGYGDARTAWKAKVAEATDNNEAQQHRKGEELDKKRRHKSVSESTLIRATQRPPATLLKSSMHLTPSMIEKHSAQIAEGEGSTTSAGIEKDAKIEAWIQSTAEELHGASLDNAGLAADETTAQKTVHWLREPQFLSGMLSKARVLLFQYCVPADKGKSPQLKQITEELARRLEDARKDNPDRPIIFVGHDFGITIIENTLINLSKPEAPGGSICKAAAGIVYFALESPTGISDQSRYLEIAVRGRLGLDPKKIPYQEVTRDAQFVVHHLDRFRGFTRWLAERRPEITLRCFVSNGKFVTKTEPAYCAFLKLISDIQDVYKLLVAACRGNVQMVKMYLERGATVNSQNPSGQSALHLSVQHGQRNVVRLLTKTYNADVSLCDSEGQTPLHLAIMHCAAKQDIVEMLLQRGAEINVKNNVGRSPLDLAKSSKLDPAIFKKRLVEGPSEDAMLEGVKDPVPPRFSSAIHACHDFHATVADFFLIDRKERFLYDQPTVHEVLYESGPDEILDALRTPDVIEKPGCRWIHLPANNVAWLDCLLAKMKIITDSLMENQHEGPTPWSHYMRPQTRITKPQKQEQKPGGRWTISEYPGINYMLFMPYLSYEAACDQYSLYDVIMEPPSFELQMLGLDEKISNIGLRINTLL